MDADDESTPAITHPEGAPCPLDSDPNYACPRCHRRHQEGDFWLHQHLEASVEPRQEADSQSREERARQKALRSRRERSTRTAVAETSQYSAEIHRPSEEGSTIRSTAKSRRRARKKELSRRKKAAETTPSKSSAEIHRPSEEEASTMAEVDARLHEEEEMPDWMSQLFEKLDSEVNADSICSTQKVAQVESRPIMEGGISSEVHRSSKGKNSTMAKVDIGDLHEEDQLPDWMSQLFEKLDLEANKDDDSTGKVAQGETHSLLEGGVSSEIHRSLDEKDSTMFEKMELEASKDGILSTGKVGYGEIHPLLEGGISSEAHKLSKERDLTTPKLYFGGLYDDDKFLDWMIKICCPHEVDQEEEYPVHDDVPDEFNDLIDEEANDEYKSMKKASYRKTIENGIKWMSEECFLAFTKSAENFHFEGIKHKFGELRSQCFSVEAYDKIFHHYNFTIEEKHGSSDVWTSKLYFAEVKQLSGVKSYLCCLLEPNDRGHCYGCKNQDMYDLKHPSRGGYEEGDPGICCPFMDDPEYDSSNGDDYDHSY